MIKQKWYKKIATRIFRQRIKSPPLESSEGFDLQGKYGESFTSKISEIHTKFVITYFG